METPLNGRYRTHANIYNGASFRWKRDCSKSPRAIKKIKLTGMELVGSEKGIQTLRILVTYVLYLSLKCVTRFDQETFNPFTRVNLTLIPSNFFFNPPASGGWVKIQLKLPHFHVSKYMSCANLTERSQLQAVLSLKRGYIIHPDFFTYPQKKIINLLYYTFINTVGTPTEERAIT